MIKDHLGHTFRGVKEMYLFWGLNEWTYYERKMAGWSLEKILTTPLRERPEKSGFKPLKKEFKLISEKSYRLEAGTVTIREYQEE